MLQHLDEVADKFCETIKTISGSFKKLSGMKNSGTLLFALAVGAPTAIGAAIGSAIGDIAQEIPGICIGIGAGAMAYLTIKELLPIAFKERKSGSLVCLVVGAAVGAAMVLAL